MRRHNRCCPEVLKRDHFVYTARLICKLASDYKMVFARKHEECQGEQQFPNLARLSHPPRTSLPDPPPGFLASLQLSNANSLWTRSPSIKAHLCIGISVVIWYGSIYREKISH